jgi:clan AA aspartic protease (TIGR02281 family)
MSTFATAAISFVAGVALAAWVTSGHETAPPSRPADPPVSPAVMPKSPPESFPRVVRVPVTDDNQCFVTASSNLGGGRSFRALIDTGADGVYLDRATALLLGFNPSRADFKDKIWTADGRDRAAWVRLPELDVAGFKLRDVPAWVEYGELDYPLIGLSILKRLGRFEVAHGQCSLMW